MDSYPAPCFEDIFYKLTGFEDKLQSYQPTMDVSPHQAFYTNRGGYSGCGRGGYRGGYRGRGSYTTQGRGFPQQFGQSAQRSSNGAGAGAGNRPTCQICGKYGHSANACYRRFDLHFAVAEQQPQANVLTTNYQAGAEW